MRLAFTHQLHSPGAPAGALSPETVRAICDSLQRLGHQVEPIEVSGELGVVLSRLERARPELVFEASPGHPARVGDALLPALLERLSLPFTGPDARARALVADRHLTKLALADAGLATPRSAFLGSLATGLELRMPVRLRPNFGSGAAVEVEDMGALRRRLPELLAGAPSGVVAEELRPGRCLSVAYIEGAAPATHGVLDAGLGAPAVELVRRVVGVLRLRDWARLELHQAEDGTLSVLEVDALLELEGGSALHAAAGRAGLGSLDALLAPILQSAALRYGLPRPRPLRSSRRVGFTFNLKRVVSTPTGEVDSDAEFDSPKVIAAVREAIASYGHEVVELEATADLPARLAAAQVDVVFNMAEGLEGRNREAHVPALLEMLGVQYSGSDAATMCLTLDKSLAKRVVAQAGIPTAPFLVMHASDEPLPAGWRYPAIVKPVAEGSSKGVLKSSVVHDEAELRARVASVVEKYRQGALVEAFLPGREFTLALLGERDPRVLPPMEIVFTNPANRTPVYAFDAKLDWSTDIRYDRPAQVDPALGAELARVARAAFEVLGCRDLARVDLRLDDSGRVNFIEVNPLPGLSPGWSDLCLIAESAGMDYRTLIGEILAPALRRSGGGQ